LAFTNFGRSLDHQRELGFVHEHPRHGELGQHDGVAGPDHRVGIFHEHVERARLALCMFPIIGDAGEDFSRPRQRRPQAHRGERQGGGFADELFQHRAQALEIVNDALHGQLRRIAFFNRRRDVDYAAGSEHAGRYFGA
jgi:hypothetical protein